MPGSYEKINYALRPAKAIERKMLSHAFRRLSPFGRLETYRYVGFGSTYFSDFILFHKSLGINNMISIEKDVENKERFKFNCPYGCIEMIFEESTAVLAELAWEARTILWLDYDYPLKDDMLADVKLFCASAISGSVIVVTVDARADGTAGASAEQLADERYGSLAERVGEAKVPRDVSGKDLAGWGTARIYRRIIGNEIVDALEARNGVRDAGTKILYDQLFNFQYADTAKMLSVGGLLYDEGEANKVPYCSFRDLDFVAQGDEPYSIEVPSLTYKEIRHLDAQLPVDDCNSLCAPSIPMLDLERYRLLYRYFPTFAETEV